MKNTTTGAIICTIFFLFALCLGQLYGQDTVAKKAVSIENTVITEPMEMTAEVQAEIESPFNLNITWMAISSWVLGFLLHTMIKVNKTSGTDNIEKVKKFFRENLFKFLISLISAILLLVLLVSLIDSINSSQIKLEKLPSWIQDYGNFGVAFACVLMGFGNSSFMLWLLKVGKEKAKLDYPDDELDTPKNQ